MKHRTFSILINSKHKISNKNRITTSDRIQVLKENNSSSTIANTRILTEYYEKHHVIRDVFE